MHISIKNGLLEITDKKETVKLIINNDRKNRKNRKNRQNISKIDTNSINKVETKKVNIVPTLVKYLKIQEKQTDNITHINYHHLDYFTNVKLRVTINNFIRDIVPVKELTSIYLYFFARYIFYKDTHLCILGKNDDFIKLIRFLTNRTSTKLIMFDNCQHVEKVNSLMNLDNSISITMLSDLDTLSEQDTNSMCVLHVLPGTINEKFVNIYGNLLMYTIIDAINGLTVEDINNGKLLLNGYNSAYFTHNKK